LDWVGKDADLRDFHLDAVTVVHWCGACWGAGGNDVAWQQSHGLGDLSEDATHLHNHLIRVGVLLLLTLALVGQVSVELVIIEVQGIEVGLDPWADWAESINALRACPLTILELQVTGGNIVADGKTEYVVLPVFRVDVLGDLGDKY